MESNTYNTHGVQLPFHPLLADEDQDYNPKSKPKSKSKSKLKPNNKKKLRLPYNRKPMSHKDRLIKAHKVKKKKKNDLELLRIQGKSEYGMGDFHDFNNTPERNKRGFKRYSVYQKKRVSQDTLDKKLSLHKKNKYYLDNYISTEQIISLMKENNKDKIINNLYNVYGDFNALLIDYKNEKQDYILQKVCRMYFNLPSEEYKTKFNIEYKDILHEALIALISNDYLFKQISESTTAKLIMSRKRLGLKVKSLKKTIQSKYEMKAYSLRLLLSNKLTNSLYTTMKRQDVLDNDNVNLIEYAEELSLEVEGPAADQIDFTRNLLGARIYLGLKKIQLKAKM